MLSDNKNKKNQDFRLKRNARLNAFFLNLFDSDEFRIIGKVDNPIVVYKNREILSCFVHNFNLRFTDLPHNGKVVYETKLTQEDRADYAKVQDWFNSAKHRRCYRIKLKGTDLFLAGFNLTNKIAGVASDNENGERYPVFSRLQPRIYFNKDYAKEAINPFVDKYELEII